MLQCSFGDSYYEIHIVMKIFGCASTLWFIVLTIFTVGDLFRDPYTVLMQLRKEFSFRGYCSLN